MAYSVNCFSLLLRSFFFFFPFPFSFAFFIFTTVSFHSFQLLCPPWYVRPHIHTYKPCTYHYDCCTISRGVNRKPKFVFFWSVFLGFSTPKTNFVLSVFRLLKKTETEKTTGFILGRFFSPVPYANNAYISVLKRHAAMYGQSSSPRRQQHAAEQHGTGITFFYIPGTGIGMMTSYPLRGLYRIQYRQFLYRN